MRKSPLTLLLILFCALLSGADNHNDKKFSPEQKAQIAKARERMKMEKSMYSKEQLEEIESLYVFVSKNHANDAGAQKFKELARKYPKSNRVGCAALSLAMSEEGQKREDALRRVIGEYSDCWYGDGVNVGAYARYLIGMYNKSKNQTLKVQRFFNEIKNSYPDAIDHEGVLLVKLIERAGS